MLTNAVNFFVGLTMLFWLLHHRTLLYAYYYRSTFVGGLELLLKTFYVLASIAQLSFLSWIAHTNFVIRLRILFNFCWWSCIVPTNFATYLQILLDFLWLSYNSLLTFCITEFATCLRLAFQLPLLILNCSCKLCWMLVNTVQLSSLILHCSCKYYLTFLVACNFLLTFCITELCYMLASIAQLSLVILHFSCKFCYMLASIAQLSLAVLQFSSNFLYHRTLLHGCEYCSTFFDDL